MYRTCTDSVVVVFFSKMNLTHRVKDFEQCVIAAMSLLKTEEKAQKHWEDLSVC